MNALILIQAFALKQPYKTAYIALKMKILLVASNVLKILYYYQMEHVLINVK